MELNELRDAFRCRRNIKVAPRVASRAVLQMRRASGFHRRWSLGDRGSFEIEGDVVEVTRERQTHQGAIHIPGRLWDPAGTTMTKIDVEVTAESEEGVEVSVSPAQRLPEWFHDHELEHWRDLARAALEELCEEILWHASRDTQAGAINRN